MPENNRDRIERVTQRLMEEVHRDFLLKMHERFGISNLPSPVKIELRKTEESGLIDFRDPDNITIYLDPNGSNSGLLQDFHIGGAWLRIPDNSGLESLWLERYHPFWFYDRVYTCAHESAHYLHYLVNPELYIDKNKTLPFAGTYLFETLRNEVVTVGTLDYFRICGNLGKIMEFVEPNGYEERVWEKCKHARFNLEKLARRSFKELAKKNVFDRN